MVYDNDKMFKALRARSLARRAYKAALLAYEVRDPNETPDFQMQRELYLKGSKDGRTPTFSSSLKQMLGCGKSGMYAAHHRLVKAERAVEKAIQELKKQDETVKKGEYKPVYDGPGNTQLDDMDMQNHRRPIFAFVTFQSEDQQSFIKKYYDKGYLINRKRRQDGLECLVNYVQNTSEGEGWLKHPLPANAPADVKAARKQLGADLLDNCVCVEAQEPSDINWETQGYLTTKMPLGDPALDFTNRPGGANKWCHRVFRSFAAYTAAGFILVVLFTILLFVTVWTQQLLDFLGIKDATTITAVGYGIAGIITLINILLPNIMKQFVFRLEINTSETEKQTSLVIKLTLVGCNFPCTLKVCPINLHPSRCFYSPSLTTLPCKHVHTHTFSKLPSTGAYLQRSLDHISCDELQRNAVTFPCFKNFVSPRPGYHGRTHPALDRHLQPRDAILRRQESAHATRHERPL